MQLQFEFQSLNRIPLRKKDCGLICTKVRDLFPRLAFSLEIIIVFVWINPKTRCTGCGPVVRYRSTMDRRWRRGTSSPELRVGAGFGDLARRGGVEKEEEVIRGTSS
jgi:hypothetical protein